MITKSGIRNNIHFVSFVGRDYSRSSTILNYQSKYFNKFYKQVDPRLRNLIPELFKFKNEISTNSIVVIMSPCHKLVIFSKLILRKKVILDAGWPLTDGVLSRGLSYKSILNLVKIYCLDFLSFHFSDLVLVESIAQSIRISHMFALPVTKIKVSLTGVNEKAFEREFEFSKKFQEFESDLSIDEKSFVILFRGKINNESGIETIIASARILEKEVKYIIATGIKNNFKNLPSNCYVISDISECEMRRLYEISHIALGQISNHNRLSHTIPHKAFEAGYFGKCFISPYAKGVSEIYSLEAICELKNISAMDLAHAINNLREFSNREKYEKQIKQEYIDKCSQVKINSNFEHAVFQLIQNI